MPKKWIQGAVKHPGSLRSLAAKTGGLTKTGRISKKWLAKKAKVPGVVGKRARLAQTFNTIRKKKSGGRITKINGGKAGGRVIKINGGGRSSVDLSGNFNSRNSRDFSNYFWKTLNGLSFLPQSAWQLALA